MVFPALKAAAGLFLAKQMPEQPPNAAQTEITYFLTLGCMGEPVYQQQGGLPLWHIISRHRLNAARKPSTPLQWTRRWAAAPTDGEGKVSFET